jgi:hypothetical protein
MVEGSGESGSNFQPDRLVRRHAQTTNGRGLRASPLPRNAEQELCQVEPHRAGWLDTEAEPQAWPFLYVPSSLGSSFPWQLASFRDFTYRAEKRRKQCGESRLEVTAVTQRGFSRREETGDTGRNRKNA